ncbi:DUF6078 family protein [Parabacteroides sp. AM08-6]|uniref:DUF6078 family protein n=1 Tax=Parabacteroides sp. AM08-6 TaxID=2292053 RepID=UPI000EFE0063|nr:DUF6078 family protein [Parabacteroides sp. AM08-6]RHJ82562.1 hypothetical protein DW103_09440 [Parabacteroides sp. AM08-6]
MEKDFDFSTVPYQYPLCLNRQCPKAANCLRQIAERHMPDSTAYCYIVNPRHLATLEGDCPYFRSDNKIQYAKGFIGFLEKLPHRQMLQVSNTLIACFNRRTYFRVRKGERLLSPAEQQIVADTCRECGVSIPVVFDAYLEDYDW